jgi:hypothetical protein
VSGLDAFTYASAIEYSVTSLMPASMLSALTSKDERFTVNNAISITDRNRALFCITVRPYKFVLTNLYLWFVSKYYRVFDRADCY